MEIFKRFWGRKPSAETRRRMSEAHRRRGTRPTTNPPDWTPEEEALLGEIPDAEVCRRTGRTLTAVRNHRQILRIPCTSGKGMKMKAAGSTSI
jgi:hypothetical protein